MFQNQIWKMDLQIQKSGNYLIYYLLKINKCSITPLWWVATLFGMEPVSRFWINYLCSFTSKLPVHIFSSRPQDKDRGRVRIQQVRRGRGPHPSKVTLILTISLHFVSRKRHIDSKFRPSSPQVSFAEIKRHPGGSRMHRRQRIFGTSDMVTDLSVTVPSI